MRLKIKIKDFEGNLVQIESQKVRDEWHLQAQMKNKSFKFKDKSKVIPRKAKYKGLGD